MDKVLSMTYASSLTDLCEINSSFDMGILRICYTGENRNGSFISRETLERCLPTIYNCPLVCNYNREDDTLGGHDIEIVRSDDGDLRLVNVTTPVGVIPESSRVWIEDFEEIDGTIHEYLYAEVLLWKRQEAYKKIKSDGITAHSMEIKVNKGKSIDGVYHVEDFEFNAFCLINVEPCFESSALEVFSKNNFKEQLSEMMHDLKDTLITVNSYKKDDNIYKNYSMEGGQKVLDEKMKLVAKYNIDVDSLDFSIEDLTVEELTEKFEAMKNTQESVKPENESDENFALTANIVEEIRRVLCEERITDSWGDDIPHYFYVDCDFDAKEVYCWDTCDWLLYGFSYSMNGDSVVIDFASKKRVKYVIADFEEGEEQASPIAAVFENESKRHDMYKELEEKFTAATNQISSMSDELEELRQFKADTEDSIAQSNREEVFSHFEDLDGIEAFEELKETCSEYDVATLEEKCFAIRGRNGAALKFSAKEKTPKLKVDKTDISKEPYGGLMLKYACEG